MHRILIFLLLGLALPGCGLIGEKPIVEARVQPCPEHVIERVCSVLEKRAKESEEFPRVDIRGIPLDRAKLEYKEVLLLAHCRDGTIRLYERTNARCRNLKQYYDE